MRNRISLSVVLGLFFMTTASANEKNFLYLPKSDDVRLQKIAKVDNEKGWPFTVDSGILTCMYAAGKPLVIFHAKDGFEPDGVSPNFRSVTVSIDPLESIFGNMAVNDLIADDGGKIEKRMALFGKFYEVGRRLCDQPKGSNIGSGEL